MRMVAGSWFFAVVGNGAADKGAAMLVLGAGPA